MNILFWNIQKKNLSSPISELAGEHDLDLIAFAEADSFDPINLFTLGYRQVNILGKVKIFTKYDAEILKIVTEGVRSCVLIFDSPINGKVLICFCHMISAMNYTRESMMTESMLLAGNINSIRSEFSCSNIIICGDFNQNPYDFGVVGAPCFHATLDREIARKNSRTVQGSKYHYFYNPMWRFYGAKERPFGTYFHNSSDHHVVNWNILDQFLISANLLDVVFDNDIDIVKQSKNHSFLLRNGMIDSDNYSDHLPILMKSNI